MGADNEDTKAADQTPRSPLPDRIYSVQFSSGKAPDRIEPDNIYGRTIRLLTIAADHLPDHKQKQAAEELVDGLFAHAVHPKRWRKLAERGIDREQVRTAAADYLMEGVWEEGLERRHVTYSDLVERLRNYLNDRVSETLIGPEWRKVVRKDPGEPPQSAEKRREDRGTVPDTPQDDPQFGQYEARITLRRLIERADLTDSEQTALTYRKLHGYSVEETAEKMDSTPGSVRVLDSRAQAKLAEIA